MPHFDKAHLEKKAGILKGIANPYRLAIIELLRESEENGKTVNELVAELGAKQSNILRHLSTMSKMNVLSSSKEGLYNYYFLSHQNIPQIVQAVDEIFQDLLDEQQKLTADTPSEEEVMPGDEPQKNEGLFARLFKKVRSLFE